jgi:glyoxylase-like metal-dependent hydrolase (beta-lactamase superfamily II)
MSEWHFRNDDVLIRKIEVGTFGNNTYIVACAATRAAVIVDAAADPERIIDATTDVVPSAILTTHGHPDHVAAARNVSATLAIPIRLHRADWEICPIEVSEDLSPGTLELGSTSIRLVHTPGHTPGSTCLIVDGAVVTGDTLFPGGPGATRFPYSDFDQIMDSLERELFTLPDETVVMPGHGLDTTIGKERPALPEWRRRRW